MRQAGNLPAELDPQPLVDYLLTQGIEAQADKSAAGSVLWIYDEALLESGKRELAAYVTEPTGDKYQVAKRAAEQIRRDRSRKAKRAAANHVQVRDRWQNPSRMGNHFVTWALIALCAGVALFTNFGDDLASIRPYLFIAKITNQPGMGWSYLPGLQEIRHGEVWRLFTPMLIHMNLFHFLFNMMWLFLLGGRIETRYGSLGMLALVLVGSALSNLAQYGYAGPELLLFGREVDGGPFFGGMSGVNYALFGFAWMQTLRVRTGPPLISERDVFVLLVWFAVCFTGWVGPVANIAHAVGLIVGVLAGLPRWRG